MTEKKIMQTLLCSMTSDGRILSPAVGVFFHSSNKAMTHNTVIGILERLGKLHTLILERAVQTVNIVIPSGTPVVVGDVIAQVDEDITIIPCDHHSSSEYEQISAPAAGFVMIHDHNGRPLKSTGDKIVKGDIVAILEFMKIRMEIAYHGYEPAVFDKYLIHHQSAVQHGQIVAVCKKHKRNKRVHSLN